jgi:hypothetical protein
MSAESARCELREVRAPAARTPTLESRAPTRATTRRGRAESATGADSSDSTATSHPIPAPIALREFREFLAFGGGSLRAEAPDAVRILLGLVDGVAARDPADEARVKRGLAAVFARVRNTKEFYRAVREWESFSSPGSARPPAEVAAMALYRALWEWERGRPVPGARPSARDAFEALVDACHRPWPPRAPP